MTNLITLKSLINNAKNIADSLLFPSFYDSQRTPLIGEEAEDKEDTIDYLNGAMDNQAVHILQAFTDVDLTDTALTVVNDIFEEGVSICYLVEQEASQMNESQVDNYQAQDLQAQDLQAQDFQEQGSQSQISQAVSDAKIAKQKNRSAANLQKDANSKTVFIPFRTRKGRPVERLYILGAEAQIKLGIFDDIVKMILPLDKDENDFKVIKTEFVSKNMLRIIIKSDIAFPQNDAGYAYRFELENSNVSRDNNGHTKSSNFKLSAELLYSSVQHLPKQLWQHLEPTLKSLPNGKTIIQTTKKYGLLTVLGVYKRLPEVQERQKAQPIKTVVEKRYYTLRQLKSNNDAFVGEVDIYIHDNTQGSVWAKSLRAGDSIKVDSHYEETIKDMTIGQPLFVCDETSMPSVAATLERWQTDIVPIVISITNDTADLAYFEDMVLPDLLKNNLQIQHINTSEVDNLADAVIDLIKIQGKKIDCAWGAIGKADFRPIKKYLRDEHGLKGKLNRVRAYWV